MKIQSLIAAALIAASAGAASAATSFYSFETPAQGSGSGAYTYDPSPAASGGVTFAGGAGVQANGSAWGFANAPDGVQTAFLQNDGSITLPDALVAGHTYTINLFDSERPGYGTLPFALEYNGATLDTYNAGSTWAAAPAFTFKATASGTLSLVSTAVANVGDSDVGIDAVSIAAVPEPATWSLMFVGAALIGFGLRSRRSTALAA